MTESGMATSQNKKSRDGGSDAGKALIAPEWVDKRLRLY